MKTSQLRKIIQEELKRYLLKETKKLHQDDDIFYAIVDEIKRLGYDAYHSHRQLGFRGVYIYIEDVDDRFWFENWEDLKEGISFTIYPENDPVMKFEGFVYQYVDEDEDEVVWVAEFDPEFKKYLNSMTTEKGRKSRRERRNDFYNRV